MKVPNKGDVVYVPPCDTATGGKAVVAEVFDGISAGETVPFIRVEGQPDRSLNWEFLAEMQPRLKMSYGWGVSAPDGHEGRIIDGHLWLKVRS